MNLELRQQIEEADRKLRDLRENLTRREDTCFHSWSTPVADHIYHDAYTIPGDEPGTMGSDWRGPCYVEARTEKRWKRTCRVCGKVQTTGAVTTVTKVEETPRF